MSKTMKIIDLLNKIANREQLPKNILYENEEYVLNYQCYFCCDHDLTPLFNDYVIYRPDFLNSEIEIIEEQEEIDIQAIKENNSTNARADVNQENINLLIKAVKQLDKNIKEK